MKNPPFQYHRPTSLQDALALLDEHEDAKVLAGGQSLLPIMALRLGRPEHVVDIANIPGLDSIIVGADGSVTIGALVRHAAAERSDDIAEKAPLIHQAMPHVGHRAIRTRGTVVGSIAHADPAAEMPAVVLATNATMVIRSSSGQREVAAADFFHSYLTTAVQPNEILTEVKFPAWSANSHGAVVEEARRHGDYAMVGLACRFDVSGGEVTDAALAFFGVDQVPVRVPAAEAALVGSVPTDEAFDQVATIVSETLNPTADGHGSTNYRRHLAGVLTRRGLAQATKSTSTGVPA